MRKAIRIAERYRLSIWDAAIVASALLAECEALYTEDMQDGQVFEGRLTVVNPFKLRSKEAASSTADGGEGPERET